MWRVYLKLRNTIDINIDNKGKTLHGSGLQEIENVTE